MPISVTCSECQSAYRVPDETAGKAIKCKKCGARIDVPAGGGDAGDDDTGAGPPKKKGGSKMLLIIGGVVVFLFCCVCTPIGGVSTWWFGFRDSGGGGAVGSLDKKDTLRLTDPMKDGKPTKEYKIKLEKDKKYVIDVKADVKGNPLHDPVLKVIDPKGVKVADNDDITPGKSFDAQVKLSPPAAGEYTIQVTTFAILPAEGMPYHITVKLE